MTQQQLEERKAEKEVFDRLRAIKREIRKERKRMGDDAYDEYLHRASIEAAEEFCREHPGYQIVMLEHGGYRFKKLDAPQA
ncbi:hypothetical protein FACS1894200_14320 [Spirochaetia bacterium]|nr:hypothetical protein FACS1894200_14320 [Spirochaetia bacterium]